MQCRLVGRFKHKDTRFHYLCCRIEDFSLFGSHPKLAKSTIQESVKTHNSQLANKGITTGSTETIQPKSWTARSKSRILQQSSLTTRATFNDITSFSQSQANSPILPTNDSLHHSPLSKRSHTEAFSSTNDNDLYSAPNPSCNNTLILIAGSSPIWLSLIVGKSKCDAHASVTHQNFLTKSPNPPGYPAFW